MHSRCKAPCLACVEDDYDAAQGCTNEAAINLLKDKKYVKFEIARLFYETDEMKYIL